MKVEGLRYSFVEARLVHPSVNLLPLLDGKKVIGFAVTKADALTITRALNREDLRKFARRAAPKPKPAARSGRPAPRRRFRSKLKLYGHHT